MMVRKRNERTHSLTLKNRGYGDHIYEEILTNRILISILEWTPEQSSVIEGSIRLGAGPNTGVKTMLVICPVFRHSMTPYFRKVCSSRAIFCTSTIKHEKIHLYTCMKC
jgi:hypothetical protein